MVNDRHGPQALSYAHVATWTVFEVPFAHPRKLSSAPVQELRATILRELGVDSYST